MTPRQLMLERRNALLERLRAVEQTLSDAAVDPALRRRIESQLKLRIEDQVHEIENGLPVGQAGGAASLNWTLLGSLEQKCAVLLRECLAYLHNGLARQAGIDGGFCALADALLEELNIACELSWPRFAILADEESFSDFLQLIRIRFPVSGIWELPVLAHEFGHFASGRITIGQGGTSRAQPFVDYVAEFMETAPGSEWEHYLHELFADGFATFVLGPSYAFTCLLLRFGLSKPLADSASHPSFAKRVQMILEVLERMDNETGSEGDFTSAIDMLSTHWQEGLQSSGISAPLADPRIKAVAGKVYYILKRSAGNARYRGWSKARGLMPVFRNPPGPAPETCDIRDVLNTAWIARLTDGSVAAEISRRAAALCSHAAGGPR